MKKHPNLTLKRVLKQFKKHPQDKNLHEIIKGGSVSKNELKRILKKAVKFKSN